jgi:hypothetical protein
MRRALARYGGVLVAPRTTVAALDDDEGHRDGVWLSALYLAATGTYGLVEGVANLMATRNLNGGLMVLSALGRALIVPIVTLVVCETILGNRRAHRRGLCLVPMLASAVLLRQLPWRTVVSWAYAPEAVGLGLAVALAIWIRPAVPEVSAP